MDNAANATPSPPPSAKLLEMLTGKWISQAISTAAKLNIADQLADGPVQISRLAERSNTNPRALLGLMRALASVGVFAETEPHHFANTPMSEGLQTRPESIRALALFLGDRPTWDAWGELAYSVRTGESAFKHVHGELPYEYFGKRPDCAYYDEAFTSFSNQETAAVLHAAPFSEIKKLVDIGGGHGTMLCSSLRQNETQEGILFDQAHVVAGAGPVVDSFGVGSRCSIVPGDFFESVPEGADGYLIKHVLFNWDDERASRILTVVRRAMSKDARLFIVDPVIRPGPGQVFAKFMDLEMMVLHQGGCQRTQAEFDQLLSKAGFKLVKVTDTPAPSSVVEAVPV